MSLVALALVAAAPAGAAPLSADRDGDKVFDDLSLQGDAARPVLVALREPATAARLRAIEQDVGQLGAVGRLRIVNAFSARATPSQVRALAARADVANVEADSTVVPFGVTAQAGFGVTQAVRDVPDLDGRGLVAAVIDSGADPTMPDLAGQITGWKDLVNGRTDPYDDLGHGSMVSAILAGTGASGAEGRGVAPAAKLVEVKVVDGNAQSSLSLIAQGIQWAVENKARYGIDAINLSIGDPTGCGDGTDVASQAVDAAVEAGIVVVAAAGNSGPANCTIKAPGAAESAITVGAMADPGAGGFSQGWFSSRGPTADGRIKPDISAPGVNVIMPVRGGGYQPGSGTSASAPFVTGAALLMLDANPVLTPAQVKDAMERTAIDWGTPGRDDDYGSGRLDVYAALRAVGATLATPPAEPAHAEWSDTLAANGTVAREVDVADDRQPLAVTMLGPALSSANFDLSVLDPSGKSVGTVSSQPVASRQEDLTVQAPAPGAYTVRVDPHSGSAGGDFVVDVSGDLAPADTTAPALTLDAAAVTNTPTPTLAGTAGTALGDFPGVVVTIADGSGSVVRRLGAAPLLGAWSAAVQPALPDGTYTATVTEGDASGNISTVSRSVTVDTIAPDAPVITSAVAAGSTVTLSGTAEAGSTVAVGATHVPSDGNWTATLADVDDGTHSYTATATDAAGNVSSPSASREVVVDTVAPLVTIGDDLTVHASEPATLECKLDEAPWGSCAPIGALSPGSHVLLARATDAAGNVSAVARREWTVETPTPTAEPTVTATPTASASPPAVPHVFVTPAPVLAVTVAHQTLTSVLRHGLVVRVSCNRPVTATVALGWGKRAPVRRAVPTPLRATLTLPASQRRALAHVHRVTLTLTVTAPGARIVRRSITLSR